jgi:ribosomal protein S9
MAERGTRADIDLAALEKLCALHPTDSELASFFNVSTKTIERRKSEPAFAEAMERGRARGKLNLRRIQHKMAENNAAMAIFLGKNLLGQSDLVTHNFDIEIAVAGAGYIGEPVAVDIKALR